MDGSFFIPNTGKQTHFILITRVQKTSSRPTGRLFSCQKLPGLMPDSLSVPVIHIDPPYDLSSKVPQYQCRETRICAKPFYSHQIMVPAFGKISAPVSCNQFCDAFCFTGNTRNLRKCLILPIIFLKSTRQINLPVPDIFRFEGINLAAAKPCFHHYPKKKHCLQVSLLHQLVQNQPVLPCNLRMFHVILDSIPLLMPCPSSWFS